MGAAHHRPGQPDLPGRHQQPAGRRPVGQGAGLRAAGRQVGRVRLARAACRRQRPARRAATPSTPRVRWPTPKPRVILFDTLMGKGVPFLEQREKNHFIRVDPPEWQQALDILDRSQPQRSPKEPRHERTVADKKPRLTTSAMIASIAVRRAAREGGAVRQGAGRATPPARPEIVGLTADLAKYTDLHLFAQAYPERFFQMGMAEQLLMGAAGGMAKEGPGAVRHHLRGVRHAPRLRLHPPGDRRREPQRQDLLRAARA